MGRNFKFPPVPLSDPGYLGVPSRIKNENYTFRLDDNGCKIVHDSASAHTYTFDGNLVAYPEDFTVSVFNDTGAGVVTISASSGYTMVLAGTGAASTRALAANGCATFSIYKLSKIMGNGTGLT